MGLVPEEPVHIRELALSRARSPEWSLVDRGSVYNFYVLRPGGLPKYLWDRWRGWLRSRGIEWPLFLRAISACERDIHRWIEGELSWRDLVEKVILPVIDRAARGLYPLWPP